MQASVSRFEWLMEHRLEKIAESELETHRHLLENRREHDRSYFHQKWLHDFHRFELLAEKFSGAEYKLMKDFDFFAHVHSLNRDYLINCLHIAHYLISLSRIYKFSPEEDLLQQIERLGGKYINKGDAIIDILFNSFYLERTDDEKYFYELKAVIWKMTLPCP